MESLRRIRKNLGSEWRRAEREDLKIKGRVKIKN